MRRVLLWSFGALLVLVTAAIVSLFLVDLSRYRGALETQASAALGRKVEIAGNLEIKASLTPTLAATQVTIANVPGGSRDQMARIGRLEIGIELLPLLDGAVRITHVAMVDADIALEIGGDGRGNWLFAQGEVDAGAPEMPSESPGYGGQVPFIGLLELRDTVVSHTGISGRTRRLDIDHATLATASENDEVRIEIECVIDGQPVQASATTGSLSALLAGTEGWPVQMALSMGESRISAQGTIADPTTFRRYEVMFDADMASIDPIAILLDQDLPTLPPFSISGSVAADADEIRMSQLSVILGRSDIGGDLQLSLAGERPAIAGGLSSRRLDLAELSMRAPEPSAEVASDPVIPVDSLAAVDLDLRLRVDEFVSSDLAAFGVQGRVLLDDRHLEVVVEQARFFDGSLTADLSLNGRVRPPAVAMTLAAGQIDIGALLRDLQASDAVMGHADADLALEAEGATRQALIASADGRVTIIVGPGQINSALAGLVGRSAVTAILPIGTTDTVELHCAVGDFDVAGGVATSTVLLVDSQHATIAGEGAVDLGGNRLDMVFNPRSKDPKLLALVAPIRVHGPIDQPEVSVLTGDLVADTATNLLLGVINPIAIFVPFVTAGTGDDNRCLAALNDETNVQSGSAPGRPGGGAVDAGGGVAEGAAGIVGGVTGGVGDAAAGVGGVLGNVGRGVGGAIGGIFGGDNEPDRPADD